MYVYRIKTIMKSKDLIIMKLRKWLPFKDTESTINTLVTCIFVLYTCMVRFHNKKDKMKILNILSY